MLLHFFTKINRCFDKVCKTDRKGALRSSRSAPIRNFLICNAPNDHLVGLFAADGAYVADMLLLKGHAARRHTGHFLDLLLAGEVAAPHGLDVARFDFQDLDHLVEAFRREGAVHAVLKRLVIEVLLF